MNREEVESLIKSHTLDRLGASIPLVDFASIDVTRPALVRVLVDSHVASKMLALNLKNRRQRKNAVDYLKRQIENGEWRDDHPQPIIFSDAGRLIDGQHRLQAISELDIDKNHALVIRVETGARDDVREYLDTGVSRSLDDRVELVANQIHNKVITQLCQCSNMIKYGNNSKRPSPEEAKEFFSLHTESSVFVASIHKSHKGVGRIQVALAAMEYYELDPDKAREFYPAVFVVDSNIHQARVLRDWLLRGTITSELSHSLRNSAYYRSVAAMKAHALNKPITILRQATW